jgi:hypothetical protein
MGPALGSGWGSFSNGHVTTLRHAPKLLLALDAKGFDRSRHGLSVPAAGRM